MRTIRVPKLFALAVSSTVCAAVAGCGTSNPSGSGGAPTAIVQSKLARNTAPVVASTDAARLVTDNTTFAFDLYEDLAANDGTSNLFYSPYSISIALAMTYAGALDPTAGEIATAMDFSLPQATLHPTFDALDLALASRAKGQSGSDGQPFQLNVVDSLWGDSSLKFEQPFLDTLAVNYGAGMRVVDFIGAADAARGSINSWVSDETQKRIQNLLPEGSVSSETRLVLVNAIYFNAAWASPFDPTSTKPGTFHLLDGSTAQPDMMSEDGSMGYAKGSNYQAVELTYAGNQTSMVVLVPDDGAFASVESALTGAYVTSLFASLAQTAVSLTLPKFTVQGATFSLKTQLSKLGMPGAFDDSANFSAITTQEPLHIDDVLHQAFVKVDESGTEAAAATAVILRTDLSIAPPPVTVTVDRPFFYFIRDIPTNTVLFVGRELDPT